MRRAYTTNPSPSCMQLSASQIAALLNIEAGRSSSYGLHGASAHGGHTQTLMSLQKRGLIMWDPGHKLTLAGVEELAALRKLGRIR